MMGSDIARDMQLTALGLEGDYIRSASKTGLAARPIYDTRGHQSDGSNGYYKGGKLPWHPTFSNESPFSTNKYQGGKWSKDYNGDGKIRDVYTPSLDMINNGMDIKRLNDYFKRSEPDANIVFPAPRLQL